MEKALSWTRHEVIGGRLRNPGECKITIIGVGGCGSNTVNRLKRLGIDGAECIAINTDVQHLDMIKADKKILIGERTTRGRGTGNIPSRGRNAVQESLYSIEKLVSDSDIVFVAAGLGGGTGTGAAPVIANMCKNQGAIVVGFVNMPFRHEKGRYDYALEGLQEMRKATHTTIVIDNNKLMEMAPLLPIDEAFTFADSILANMVKGIIETIARPSLINLDFADFKTIMEKGDVAIVGMGKATGSNQVEDAAFDALNHLMLDVDFHGADGALIHVSGGNEMSLSQAVHAAEAITDKIQDDAMVLWGSRVDPSLGDKIRVTLVLTGINSPQLVGGNVMEGMGLYDIDPYQGDETPIDMGLDLFDIESSWQ